MTWLEAYWTPFRLSEVTEKLEIRILLLVLQTRIPHVDVNYGTKKWTKNVSSDVMELYCVTSYTPNTQSQSQSQQAFWGPLCHALGRKENLKPMAKGQKNKADKAELLRACSSASSAWYFLLGQGVLQGEAEAQVETTCKASSEETCPGENTLLVYADTERAENKPMWVKGFCQSLPRWRLVGV